jgi:methyl-accepting chemotaxis protein-2 (aspartate sensor receptor)
MFKHMKISQALLAVVVLFLALQLTLGALGYFALQRVNADVHTLYRNSVQEGNSVNAASLSLVAARTDLSRYATRVAQGNGEEKTSLLSARKHIASADKSFAAFEAVLTDEDRKVSAPLVAAYRNFSGNLQGVGRVLEAGDMDAYLKQGTQKAQDQFMGARDDFMAMSEQVGRAAMDDIAVFHRLFITVLAVVLAISLAAAFATHQLSRRLIVRPLERVGALLTRIAAGDLTNPIEDRGNTEVGILLATLKRMQASLARTVTQVRQGVDEINIGAKEIASGNTDLSSRTEQQAASLEETAASMEELASTVKQNADSARQANQMAAQASTVAHRGHEAVDSVVRTMGAISGSSTRIAEIVGVIDSIAFQTNILALNAAVEAARAGEQGKGFAVVATEVRSLAQRSAAAAKEIKDLIEDSVQKVVVGSEQVKTAGATMQEILDAVQRVTGIMAEISGASEEQARGIDQINGAVAEMDGVTQQNAALVEQAAAAAASLESQAHKLAEAVNVFRLPARGAIEGGSGNLPMGAPRSLALA